MLNSRSEAYAEGRLSVKNLGLVVPGWIPVHLQRSGVARRGVEIMDEIVFRVGMDNPKLLPAEFQG